MPAVHSRGVYLARVSGESCSRGDWVSATLYTLAESFQSMRGKSVQTRAGIRRMLVKVVVMFVG